MSLLFGTVGPQKEEISDLIQQMFQGMREVPHLEAKIRSNEYGGFGYLETKNTAIHQQLLSEHNLLFAAKGKLDNRSKLLALLQLSQNHSDADIMFSAWKKWGKASVKQLRGDWAFAVQTEQELFLARDPHGYTALYYFEAKNHLFFSTSPKGIFTLACFKKRLDLDFFLEGLLILPTDRSNGTGFQELRMVPPAHTLHFSKGKVTLSQYWFPEQTEVRNYRNPQQYADELLEIFREAVRVRLESEGQVASMLSGGLDSGSVAAIAASLLHKQGKTLRTFSHVPAYPSTINLGNRLLDESENIRSTATFSGNMAPLLLNSVQVPPTQGIIEAVDKLDMYFHGASNAYWMLDICRTSGRMGYPVLLSGEMGNATISFPGVPALLPWYHTAALKNPKFWLKQNLKSLLINRLHLAPFSRVQIFSNYIKSSYVHSMIKEEAMEKLNERVHLLNANFSSAQEGMLKNLSVGTNLRCAIGQQMGDAFGIELRDPTADLNVIEYCLSIPNEAFFTGAIKGKSVLRNMMKNHLPHEVLNSPKKGLQSSDLVERFRNDQEGVENLIAHLSKHAQVKEIFDLASMYKDWQILRDNPSTPLSIAQQFSKTLMFAYFLSKMEG